MKYKILLKCNINVETTWQQLQLLIARKMAKLFTCLSGPTQLGHTIYSFMKYEQQ